MMVVYGATFVRRAQIFFTELKSNRYPNSHSLGKLCNCSKNTAQRTIYRLRDEYFVPFEYDASEKGYFLKDPNYVLPAMLPPGKDELSALLLARSLVENLEAQDLLTALSSLWHQFSSSNSAIGRDLEPLASIFSSDLTSVSRIADTGILQFVTDAATGQDVRVLYESPWSGAGEKYFEGRVLRVHYGDGSLYLLFADKRGRKAVLNATFIKEYQQLNESVKFGDGTLSAHDLPGGENWLDGFGVFSGERIEQVKIEILPPASKYYATQRWHDDQEDSWDGEVLIRRIPSVISPELCRRVLSLGRFVRFVEPKALADEIRIHAQALLQAVEP